MSITIKIVDNDTDRDGIFKGRYKVYCEEMGVMPPNARKRVLDQFDGFENTINIASICDGKLVGGLRVTESTPGVGAPADEHFDFRPYIREGSKVTSSSMLFLEKDYRGHAQLVSIMFMMGYFWSKYRGADYILAPVNPAVARKLARVGFRAVGEDFDSHGLPVKPMLWDLRDENQHFNRFIEKHGLNTFAHNFHAAFFEPGEYLMRMGEEGDAAYVLLEGEVDVIVGEDTENEVVIDRVGPGEIIGEVALLSKGRRTASIRATCDTHCVVLDRQRFQKDLANNPHQALKLLEIVGERLGQSLDLLHHKLNANNTKGEPITKPYNPTLPEIVNNPYPTYAHIRQREPIHFNQMINAWMVFGYEEVKELLLHKDISSKRAEAIINKAPAEVRDQITTFKNTANNMLLFIDPPEHRRKRALTSQAFSMRMVRKLEPQISAILDEQLAKFKDAMRMDIVKDLAYPLPLNVIGELLGVPMTDRTYLQECSLAMSIMVAHPKPDAESVLRGNQAIYDMYAYFQTLIKTRRDNPGDDLLSQMIVASEDEDSLSEAEILINACLFLFAGHETTTNLLTTGTLNLLRNPEQMEKIRNNPDLLEPAIEEMLRYDSPIQLVTRVAKEDLSLSGVAIKKGQTVYAVLGAANRDPAIFKEPDSFDIERASNRHLAFGFGNHFCMGSSLARLEAHVFFSKLLETFPNLALSDEDKIWRPDIVNRGLKTLPVLIR